MSADVREFADKARAVELGDPALDPPLALRVHPDDDPMDPGARRVIKTDQRDDAAWLFVTGSPSWAATWMADEDLADWPYTSTVQAGAAIALAVGPDQHRTMKYDAEAAEVHCRCGESAVIFGSYLASEWWRRHKRKVGDAEQLVERGDMGVDAFKGGATS